jgi:uncharacterized protein YfcZ (UPF0381/DUF406 family)
LVTTPDQGVGGFVYQKWAKNPAFGYELIKASTYSNPFLPEDYADQIKANYDPILADLYLNGEFVSLTQNKVYHFFSRGKHHTNRSILESDKILHIGIDFNICGCCAIVFVIDNNNPIAVYEFISHDTQDFINNLQQFKDKTCIIYPDSSGKANKTNSSQSDISMIAQAGYQLMYKPSNPAIRDRINSVNGLLSHDRFLINTDKCQELTLALESQGYDKNGDPEKYNAHPEPSDFNDSMGYFLSYRYPVIRSMQTVKVIGL